MTRATARRAARITALTVATLVAVIVVVVLVLADTSWGNERVRRVVVSRANARLTGTLRIDTLRGHLLSRATITGVDLVDSLRAPVFNARRVEVRYGLWSALRGRIVIRSLTLDSASIVLDKRPGAKWNFASLVRPGAARTDTTRHRAPPELGDVTLRHVNLVYRRPWKPDSTLPADRRDAAIAAALASSARSRTERVAGGFQRIVEYHDVDAKIPSVQLASGGRPGSVEIASLSMIGEPYRPPAVVVRSLRGRVQFTRDSLWWRGARIALPATNAVVDGRIGFNRSGMTITVAGAPLALADLRWLNPTLPADGGGVVRYIMHVHGDTAEYAFAGADVRYRGASLRGHGAVTRVHHPVGRSRIIVRDADLTVARLSTAVLHELVPGVPLRRSGMLDGHVAVTGPANALTVDADLRFDDARAGRSHVIAHGGLGAEGGIHARDLDVRLLPLRVATLSGAGVRAPIGGAVTGSAIVNGATDAGWSVRGDLTHVEGTERSRVVGSGRYDPGTRRIAADARLEPLSLATVGRFAPGAGLRGEVSGRVHAEGTTRDLRVSGAVRSTSGGGIMEGRGAVAFHGGRTRYDVAVALDALDARAFSSRAPHTLLTGRIAARGTGFRPATADAELRADLSRSRYDTFSVDRLTAQLRVAAGVLRADTLVVSSAGAVARAAGTLGLVAERNGTLHATLVVDSLGALRRWVGSADTSRVAAASGRQRARVDAARADSVRRADQTRIERLALGLPPGEALLVDTLPAIRRDSLAGSLAVDATLRGNVSHLAIDADVRGRDLVARGNAARALDAHLSTTDVRNAGAPLAFRTHVESLQTGGYGFEQVDAGGVRRGNRLNADVRVRQDSFVSYAALGSYARPAAGVHQVQLDSLLARFDTVSWRLAHPAAARLDHGSLAVDSVDLRGSTGGRLFANGVVPAKGGVRLDVAAENVRVATVLQALQRDARAAGVVDAAAHVTGTRAEPSFTARATLREARYRGTRAPDVDVDARYANQRLALDASARDSTGRRVLVGDASVPLDLALERIAGSRRLEGALSANVALDSVRLEALPLASRNIEDVRGAVAGEAHVRGSWREPTASGHAALRGGGIAMISTGTRLSDAVADLRLVADTLHLDSLVANARGTVRASGLVDLTDRAHPVVNAGAQIRNARVMDAPRGLLDVDGDVIAVGPLDSIRVTGRAELLHGFLALKQFNKNLLRVKAPGTLAFFTVFDTTTPADERLRAEEAIAHPPRAGVIADLAVAVDRGNYYRNRPDANTEFYTEAGEELHAHIDTRRDAAWALGFVRIGDGTAIFRASTFTPARGTLTFAPYTGGPGYLEQVGERLVWEPGRGLFPVQLLTGGTSKAPAIGLESGTLFPMRGRELNGYLTIGRDETSLLQQSGSSLSGSEAWSGQLSGETGALARRQQAATALGVVLHDLGTGATKEFGLDAFSVSPADVPTELVFGKTGGVRGALIEGGRYVTVDRYLAAQLRLTSAIPGLRMSQRFGSRYRLDAGVEPRFLLRAPEDLGITHPTVRAGVFGAFLTRLWDW